MRTKPFTSGIFCSLGLLAGLNTVTFGTPFSAIQWQQPVKAGALEGQRKHVAWIRDQNNNYVDDAIDAMAPDAVITVIVQFNQCLAPADIEKRFGVFGKVRRIGTLVTYVVLDGVLASDAERIAQDPAVAGVEEDEKVILFNDTGTRVVRARSSATFSPETFADAFGNTGAGIDIAIADSGVDNPGGAGTTHTGFAGKFVSGYNALTATPGDPDDDLAGVWHGTHVAGISLGLGVGPGCRPATDGSLPNDCGGMATGAGLVDVKVCDSTGSCTTSQIIDGLEFIWTDGHARVVNMSLGSNTPSDGTSTISQVINALVENGITVVVAAGNSGANLIGAIASSELAITVAAADDHGTVDRTDDTIAGFSTFGPRVDFTGVNPLIGQLKPDITAPGVGISSAEGDSASSYHTLSGTSMATPYVTGAAALILSKNSNIPPGSLKELLKRSAFVTPAQTAAGASFPGVDGTYNVHWGFGELDVYQAGVDLSAGIADITFPSAIGSNCGGNCPISGGRPSWDNDTDIQLATDPPIQGTPNTITVHVENRTAATAENVVVCVGVKELGAGLNHFYAVGCKSITLAPLASTTVSYPWTPTLNSHQCIQVTINYGFDKDYCNNQTQRNTSPVPVNSDTTVTFRVENPFNEPTRMVITRQFGGGNDSIQPKTPVPQPFIMSPQDCAVIVPTVFAPSPGMPVGTKASWLYQVQGFTRSNPEKPVDLGGVRFDVVVVAGGIDRAYSVGRHGDQGLINLPLSLAGIPTSDPRRTVDEILVVFDVTAGLPQGGLPSPADVRITSTKGNPIPPYTVTFAGGTPTGQELTVHFSAPLPDQDRYNFNFASFRDTDGNPFLGPTSFDLRVLQGDANNSGAVTATDVSFVRGQINQTAAFGATSRADVNMSGDVTGPDVSFVRARIGHSAP